MPSTVSIPIVYDVGGVRAGSTPSSRQTGWPSALAEPVVERAVERHLGALWPSGVAAIRSPIASSANGSSPTTPAPSASSAASMRLGRLAAVVDRRALADPDDAVVIELDLHDVLEVVEPRAIVKVSASSRGVIRAVIRIARRY